MSFRERPRRRSYMFSTVSRNYKTNEIIKNLSKENKRLSTDLLFANKCLRVLITFKSFVDFLSLKFKINLNQNEWQKFERLGKIVKEVFDEGKRTKEEQSTTEEELEDKYHERDEEDYDDFDEDYEVEDDEREDTISLVERNHKNRSDVEQKSVKTDKKFKKKKSRKRVIYNFKNSEEESDDDIPTMLNKPSVTYSGKRLKLCPQKQNNIEVKSSKSPEVRTDPSTDKMITETPVQTTVNINVKDDNEVSQSLSESLNSFHDFSEKDSNCDQNIDFEDIFKTNDETNNEIIPDFSDNKSNVSKPGQKILCERLEGPLIVAKKVLNSSSEPKKCSVFKCPVFECNKWMTLSIIEKHLIEIHKQFVLICNYKDCKKVITTEDDMDLHLNLNHPSVEGRYRCTQMNCSFKTNFRKHLNQHISVSHAIVADSVLKTAVAKSTPIIDISDYKISCPRSGCQHKFNRKFLRRHLMTVHKEAVLECRVIGCDERFINFEDYRKHLETHRPKPSTSGEPRKLRCGRCIIYFDDYEEYRKHQDAHMEELPVFKCPFENCVFQYRKKCQLRYHLNKHINTVPLKCKVCGKEFWVERSLNNHINVVHSSERKFRCGVKGCDRTFKTNGYLKHHTKRVHPLVREDLKCHFEGCNKIFKHKYTYRIHIINVHSDREFSCDWPGCEYKSKVKIYVDKHRLVHSSDRNLVCHWPDCGKTYRHKANLGEHMRTHTNDKCFTCDWPECDYRTVSNSTLYKHRRLHQKQNL